MIEFKQLIDTYNWYLRINDLPFIVPETITVTIKDYAALALT